jgi:hypothetical protein
MTIFLVEKKSVSTNSSWFAFITWMNGKTATMLLFRLAAADLAESSIGFSRVGNRPGVLAH